MSSQFKHSHLSSHYKKLLARLGPSHPLRRTVLALDDAAPAPGEWVDPLGEEQHSPCEGLIHTYPDKALLLASLRCAVRCQYCTRGRLIGDNTHSADWIVPESCFQYLQTHTEIRDVLISGGDPLMLPDAQLRAIFEKIRAIDHIRTVRLGSKVPVAMPERVSPALAALLAAHRVWLQLHVVHPDELTPEVAGALDCLARAGVPMVAQTVLLRGINDDAQTLLDLFYGLLENRVKPYYLFQCDPVLGSSSFRTPVQKGLDLMKQLQGRVSGLALPNFCIDAPGGGGKVVLHPNTALRRDGNDVLILNYEGKDYRYPDPI